MAAAAATGAAIVAVWTGEAALASGWGPARRDAAAAATERLGTAVLGEALMRVAPTAEVDEAEGEGRRVGLDLSDMGANGTAEVEAYDDEGG